MKVKTSLFSVLWALIFSVSFASSVYYLSKNTTPLPIGLTLIGFNAVLFGIYTVKFIQSIKLLDEVQIRIQLEAVSIAFALSLLFVMILGMTELVKDLGLNSMSYLYFFPLLFFFYIIGLFISKHKYR